MVLGVRDGWGNDKQMEKEEVSAFMPVIHPSITIKITSIQQLKFKNKMTYIHVLTLNFHPSIRIKIKRTLIHQFK